MHLFILLALFTNCSRQQTNNDDEKNTPEHTFKMVNIPSVLTEPAERAAYLVKHYWDEFDFSDTVYIHQPQVTEQAFADYIDILPHTTYTIAAASIKDMLNKAETQPVVFHYFTDLYEKYLYDPNSPFRNDELYIPVLETVLSSSLTEEKIRPAYLLELANKNRVGEKASDFTYMLQNGRMSTLYNTKSDYILLFFYNPGCRSCKEIIEQLNSSLTINYLTDQKKLTILAVYPDEDLQEWKNYLSEIPQTWINSYDKGTHIQDEEIYDLKAIPTLYLLDKEKKVILKDTSFEQLENYLRLQTN